MKRTINIERVIHSFTVIARAINYVVRTPKIWIYLVLPFIINVILSLLLFQFVKTQFADLIEGLVVLEWFPKWQWLATFLNYLSFIIVVLLTIFAFLIMGTIVSSPFNGIIVEKILDKHEIKKMDRYSGIGLIFFEIWRAIKFEFIKIILSILVLLLTLIINLIPVVGSILFVIINYLFNAYISVLDLQDA